MEREYVIWSNYFIDLDALCKDLERENPELSDDALYQLASAYNDIYLEDERANLNIDVGNPILVIARLGLWDGKHFGYKELGGNIANCLYSDCDYAAWFVDWRGDLVCSASHHDGNNYYVYRAWKDGVSDVQKEGLYRKILSGTVKRSDITRLTERLGDKIGGVYGWTFPKRGRKKHEVAEN